MKFLDLKYLRLISPRLDGFVEKKIGTLFNCRCPICGDSSKKKKKKRGFFYEYKDSLVYKCHNCDASFSFGNFLKDFDRALYSQYALEKYKDKVQPRVRRKSKPLVTENSFKVKHKKKSIVDNLKSLADLDDTHPAKRYIIERQIPTAFHQKMFYAPKFYKWASGHTDIFIVKEADHPRLVIPWYNKDGEIFKYSARAFGKEGPKYYTIVLDKEQPQFFGLDRVDFNKPILVVEGPIDSLFLDNAIAVGSSALDKFDLSDNAVYIPDKDIRNREIMKLTRKLIKRGKNVCMLPENLPGKDIAEFVNNGIDNIREIIDNNTMSGLKAELHFSHWSKI